MEKRLPFVLLLTALAIVSIQLLRKDDAAAKGDAGSAGPSAPAVVQETFAAPKDGAERRVADAEERFVLNIGTPGEQVKMKLRTEIGDTAREFIDRSPFVVVATCDSEGRLDASPKKGTRPDSST